VAIRASSLDSVEDLMDRAETIERARSRIREYLELHGPSKADDVLKPLGQELGEDAVKQAFWQLISDGFLDVDESDTLRLFASV
jgi:predicted ArsR family transcriptional regulator